MNFADDGTPNQYKDRKFKIKAEDLTSKSRNWIRKRRVKKKIKKTEELIFAAEDQALRKHIIKARNEKQNVSPNCRMCGSHDETVQHTLCSCSKRAQCKKRHAVTNGKSRNVVENEEVKLLWNLTIQADREIHHRNQTLKYSKRRQVRRLL